MNPATASADSSTLWIELAERIGVSRDMVSKIFKELSKGGYLGYKSRAVILHKALPLRW